MTDEPTPESIAAEMQAGLAEAEAQVAAMEAAQGLDDVPNILRLMEGALQPGDDPRLVAGVAALRRILLAV